MAITMAIARRGGVRDVFGIGDRGADSVLRRHPCFRECIIARVEILSLLLHLHENTFVRRKLAILGKKLLLLRRQLADVDLLALSREHDVAKGISGRGQELLERRVKGL